MAAKLKLFPILLAALVGLGAALLLSQFQLHVWLEPSIPNDGPVVIDPIAPNSSGLSPSPVAAPSPIVPAKVPVANGLRVSNQSTAAVRLVLLSQKDREAGAGKSGPSIHWDFAPMEGSQSGLLLSLPAGNLQLQPGDILMAFAIDGSKRYWGPYIVGQSSLPIRQGNPPEWKLVLPP